MPFRPVTTSAFRGGWLNCAVHCEAAAGGPRGGDRLFARVTSDEVSVLLADVTGNGSPAADAADLLATFLNTTLPKCPAEVLAVLHSRLAQWWAADPDAESWYVEAVALRFDLTARRVEVAGGGACAVWVADTGGGWQEWELDTGLWLGVPSEVTFTAEIRPLAPGGLLFAATDGVAEAKDPSGGAFGNGGIGSALAVGPPSAVVGGVFAAVRRFVGAGWPSADASGMCFGW